MSLLDFYNELVASSARQRKRINPKEIDAALLKKAEENPEIKVTTYIDGEGEIKGHGFLIEENLITTRFDKGDVEGSVGIIGPQNPLVGSGDKPRISG